MHESCFVGGLEWTPSSIGPSEGMESWEAMGQKLVHVSVNGPRDRPYDGEWYWQAQHRANGWCNLYGTAESRESPSKIMFSFGRAFVASAGLMPSGGMPTRCG